MGDDLAAKLRKQVEFYFSDSNYPRDRFLLAQSALNPDGYVPIATLGTFNKMKELSTDIDVIANALKDSQIVKLSDDGKMVKRIAPLPDSDTTLPKSIYAKGFPVDTATEAISTFFSKFGEIASVRLRRLPDKTFKGSVLVEFATEEQAKAALEAKPQFEGKDIQYSTKAEFLESKKNEKEAKETNRKSKKRSADKKDEDEAAAAAEENKFTPGLIVKFDNVGDNATREDMTAFFAPYAKVEYMDFSQNLKQGFARFADPETVKQAVAKATEDKKEVNGKVPVLSVLEGEEEEQYWKKVQELKREKFNKRAKGGRGGGRGRGRGRGRGKKGK